MAGVAAVAAGLRMMLLVYATAALLACVVQPDSVARHVDGTHITEAGLFNMRIYVAGQQVKRRNLIDVFAGYAGCAAPSTLRGLQAFAIISVVASGLACLLATPYRHLRCLTLSLVFNVVGVASTFVSLGVWSFLGNMQCRGERVLRGTTQYGLAVMYSVLACSVLSVFLGCCVRSIRTKAQQHIVDKGAYVEA